MLSDSNKLIFFSFIAIFLIYRFFFFSNGIFFNGFGFWQIANTKLLHEDLLKTIYYFHYQPPLWNLFIGLLLKISNGNQNLALNLLLLFHYSLSIGMMFIIFKVKEKIKLNNITYIVSLSLIIFNPSIIFFENFSLYNHFSCFIFFLLFYFFFLLSKKETSKNIIKILLLSYILTQTWPLFHPFFILLVGFLIFYISKYNIKRLILLTLFFLILSIMPSIKNFYEFNFFGNGSGLGQNLSGLVFWDENLQKQCSYNNLKNEYLDQDEIKHPILNYNNHIQNSQSALNISKFCLDNSILEIKENFSNYFFYRLRVLLASHNRFSFEYFQPPKNFNNYFDFFKILKEKNIFLWNIKKATINIFFLFYYLIIFHYLLKIKDSKHLKKASICIFILHFYILFVGTFINNQEQERFRYTSGIYLNFLFIYILFNLHFKSLIKLIIKK